MIKFLLILLPILTTSLTPSPTSDTFLASQAPTSNFPDLVPYLTQDFQTWLSENGYSQFEFTRTDLPGGSYGGKSSPNDTITREPVIFIHGNGDSAIGNPSDPDQTFNGFTNTIQYLLSIGYQESELYATTWGNANPLLVADNYHSYAFLNYLRNFVEAVINYTNATKVDLITHSMGVTLGRKVIKGGTGYDGGDYDLGPSLVDYVDTFVGIAGGNWGLVECYPDPEVPTCGAVNGFFPGVSIGPVGLSSYLDNLNNEGGPEGSYVFAMLSYGDNVIGFGDLVYGKLTSEIPGETGVKTYDTLTHFQLKDLTCAEQYNMIENHQV